MLNNQIIVHDGRGRLDAADLSDSEWNDLCARNRPSTQVRLVQCLRCWDDHSELQWLQTFSLKGARVVRHQPGEAGDHPYESLETPEHRAYNERFGRVSEAEGWPVALESWAPDRKTRADVRIEGDRTITFEHQHSPFGKRGGPLVRTRLAINSGVESVFWHTDNEAIQRTARAATVAMLRNNQLPPEVISRPNVPIIISSGYREVRLWTCSARDGHLCPRRQFSGCGEVHARSAHVGALELDDVARRAPAGLLLPIHVEGVDGPADFITDLASYRRYEEWSGKSGVQLLNGRPAGPAGARSGRRRGHSKVTASRADTEETRNGSSAGTPGLGCTAVATPAVVPSTPGVCGHWVGPEGRRCGADVGVRRYVIGWRCPKHTPAATAGRPEPLPGPGWPRDRIEPDAASSQTRQRPAVKPRGEEGQP